MSKNKVHSRCRICIDTPAQAQDFVQKINSDGTIYKYYLENFEGNKRVDARSYLGVIYASSDFEGQIFLVNETEDNKMPSFINDFLIY